MLISCSEALKRYKDVLVSAAPSLPGLCERNPEDCPTVQAVTCPRVLLPFSYVWH